MLWYLFRDQKLNLLMDISLSRARVERYHDEIDTIWQRIIDEYKRYFSKTSAVRMLMLC